LRHVQPGGGWTEADFTTTGHFLDRCFVYHAAARKRSQGDCDDGYDDLTSGPGQGKRLREQLRDEAGTMAFGFSQRRLKVSAWAMQLSGLSVVLILAAGVLHRLFELDTPVALNLFMLAFVGAGGAIALATYALVRIWQHGYRGTGSALVAIAISVCVLMWPVSLLPTLQSLPSLNDVTTDTVNPPMFEEISKLRPAGSNPSAYSGNPELQTKAYPDLRTMTVQRDAVETLSLVGQALRKLRMDVVREVAPEGRTRLGFVEAVDRTLVLGFYDDVVVRVAANGSGALVDIRSASRFGRHDLGSNAERVRRIMNALVERVQATVPKDESEGRRRKRK
jgi:hypothetical protein